MWRLIGLVTLQAFFLSGGQVLLKLGLEKLPNFEWTWFFFKEVIADFWLFACCISFGFAIFLWINIINKYPFSQAYPLTSFSFVFGLYASWLIFGETIPYSRWIGMALVIAGCFLIMK